MMLSRLRTLVCLAATVLLGFLGAGCAIEGMGMRGEMSSLAEHMSMLEYSMGRSENSQQNVIYPLTEISFERVCEENRGLKILERNATSVRDYYRGGVQEKEDAEKLLNEKKWGQARPRFEQSTRLLEVVLDYLPQDEPYRNIYGDHSIIFLPNLLIADNYLKLMRIYKELKRDEDSLWAGQQGEKYLARSLMHVKTQWALQVKNAFEEEFSNR